MVNVFVILTLIYKWGEQSSNGCFFLTMSKYIVELSVLAMIYVPPFLIHITEAILTVNSILHLINKTELELRITAYDSLHF